MNTPRDDSKPFTPIMVDKLDAEMTNNVTIKNKDHQA